MPDPLPHLILEIIAYTVGLRLWLREAGPSAVPPQSWQRLVIAGSLLFGAALGAKALYLLQYAHALADAPWQALFSGKTIVGALLGGIVGVELGKRVARWPHSTGDSFVLPLVAGIAIGRVGCQLSGVSDLTYGLPTGMPWGWNYGDGILRHPVALYEILFVLTVGGVITRSRFPRPGDRFRAFVSAYLLFRLGADFLRPPHGAHGLPAGAMEATLWHGLSAIQWACAGGVAWYARHLPRLVLALTGPLRLARLIQQRRG